ncbi:MAG: ATP synthase F1 subunit delta [bacterium]
MILQTEVIAKKYASALLNLYLNKMDKACFDNLEKLRFFFKTNKAISMYLNLSSIPDNIRENSFEKILHSLKIDATSCILARALFKQKRIEIFDKVVEQIIKEYKTRKNILSFKVYSSHPLEENEKQTIHSFLKKTINATILADFFIDKTLICGIKILGDNVVWERSFVKQLNNVKRSVLHRVGL